MTTASQATPQPAAGRRLLGRALLLTVALTSSASVAGAFDAPGDRQQAVDQTIVTRPDTPAAALNPPRFSAGHGGVTCEACHVSTPAEFAGAPRSDSIQQGRYQGYVGSVVECWSCHGGDPITISGGPHGMHPVGQGWVNRHGDAVGEGNTEQCRTCHGLDYRGTVLSRSKADRMLGTEFGSKFFWRGFQVGCYACHLGPTNSDGNSNRPAVVFDASVATAVDTPVTVTLSASDPNSDPLTLRIVSQPSHGTAGLTSTLATYVPDAGFIGSDWFTFAAWDGSTDSNLGTVAVAVGGTVPPTATPTQTPPTNLPS